MKAAPESYKTNTSCQANVMLSYPIPEAEVLLKTKLDAAQSSLSNCEEDLDFLREQITVSRGGGVSTGDLYADRE